MLEFDIASKYVLYLNLHCKIQQHKPMPQRRAPVGMTQQPADEKNDEDDLLVSGPTSIGLASRRTTRSSSPAVNI